jgi:predicted phosphodiesterase
MRGAKRLPLLTLLAVMAAVQHAAAREPDGTLGLLRQPHNGLPALLTPGAPLDVMAETPCALRLVGPDGAVFEIDASWASLPGGPHRAVCGQPAGLAPGAYALEARAPDGRTDRNPRAVHVFEDSPQYYVIAHITDTHVGSDRHPRAARDIFADLAAEVNGSETSFAVITGDLTQDGAPEQMRAFLEVLDTFTVPTFVLPGNHDRTALHYEAFFGPLTYRFRFGHDGYLAFDTKDYLMADELGAQDSALQRYRRELKPCRWTIGLTHRYAQMMGMRSQLTLFVDNPLDMLLFGHYHRADPPPFAQAPWGKTSLVATPAAVDGWMRYLDVTAKGVLPREPQQLAPIE